MLTTAYRNALYASEPLKWTEAFLLATTGSLATLVGVATLYLTKSALGINLMPGPSLLHDVLYWIVV